MGRDFSLFHFINSKHGLGACYRCPLPPPSPLPKESSLHYIFLGGGSLMHKVKQTPLKRFQDCFFKMQQQVCFVVLLVLKTLIFEAS